MQCSLPLRTGNNRHLRKDFCRCCFEEKASRPRALTPEPPHLPARQLPRHRPVGASGPPRPPSAQTHVPWSLHVSAAAVNMSLTDLRNGSQATRLVLKLLPQRQGRQPEPLPSWLFPLRLSSWRLCCHGFPSPAPVLASPVTLPARLSASAEVHGPRDESPHAHEKVEGAAPGTLALSLPGRRGCWGRRPGCADPDALLPCTPPSRSTDSLPGRSGVVPGRSQGRETSALISPHSLGSRETRAVSSSSPCASKNPGLRRPTVSLRGTENCRLKLSRQVL